jgi:hypothetical protein
MTMKDRKTSLKNLEQAVEKQRASIIKAKEVIVKMEAILERRKTELLYQQMLARLDKLDNHRQQIADAIAAAKAPTDGHIDELQTVDQL